MYDGDDDFIFLATNFIALLNWLLARFHLLIIMATSRGSYYLLYTIGRLIFIVICFYTCVGFGLHWSAGFGLHWITIKTFLRGVRLSIV